MSKSRSQDITSLLNLSRTQQETIEDLLSRLLEPIGSWREECVKPSRGRRWKKLQRRKAVDSEGASKSNNVPTPSISRPDVMSHITVGFNSTMRCLETLCQTDPGPISVRAENVTNDDSTPAPTATATSSEDDDENEPSKRSKPKAKSLAIVFISRHTLPVELMSPISLAVEHASKAQASGEEKRIRLVPLSKNAETRLSRAMKIPKVGIIGLEPCRAASVLVDYVREHIPELRQRGVE